MKDSYFKTPRTLDEATFCYGDPIELPPDFNTPFDPDRVVTIWCCVLAVITVIIISITG